MLLTGIQQSFFIKNKTNLSRNRSAAGVRYRTALGAWVLMCTIKVQVPRPVCVVVPPTALELNEGKRKRERGEHSTGTYLEIWSCTALYILLVWASSMGKSRLTSVPVCADGRGISHEVVQSTRTVYM